MDIDVTVGKALAMLGSVKRLFYVWRSFYDVNVNRIERVQRKFVRYALRGLGWTDMYNLPPYVDRCALIRFETLTRRCSDSCVMFVFDVLSSRVGSPNLLSLFNVIDSLSNPLMMRFGTLSCWSV
jgi:hypothetical protein